MKKIIIVLVLLLIIALFYLKFGSGSKSIDLNNQIKNSVQQVKDINNNKIKPEEDFRQSDLTQSSNPKDFCESSLGKKMYLSEAQKIATESFCATQGTITDQYSCKKKENKDIFSLILNAKPSIFSEPNEVCITRCEIVIDSKEVTGSKQCN